MTRPTWDQVRLYESLFDVTPDVAKKMVGIAQASYDRGRDAGRAEMQRHFRLVLGIDRPTPAERMTIGAAFPRHDNTEETEE